VVLGDVFGASVSVSEFRLIDRDPYGKYFIKYFFALFILIVGLNVMDNIAHL
jgi:hypothetical protein